MKDIFLKMAEDKIAEAIENGEFDNLPGKGKPLRFDDVHLSPELRSAYKILKNNGLLPVEMELKRDILSLEKMMMDCDTIEQKEILRQKLTEKHTYYNIIMEKRRRR